jgi:hypothetical protein
MDDKARAADIEAEFEGWHVWKSEGTGGITRMANHTSVAGADDMWDLPLRA